MDYDIIMQTMMPFCAMFKIYLLGIRMCIMCLTQSMWNDRMKWRSTVEMVPVRCRVKVALHHTYITVPQVTLRIGGLCTKLKPGQEGKTKCSLVH